MLICLVLVQVAVITNATSISARVLVEAGKTHVELPATRNPDTAQLSIPQTELAKLDAQSRAKVLCLLSDESGVLERSKVVVGRLQTVAFCQVLQLLDGMLLVLPPFQKLQATLFLWLCGLYLKHNSLFSTK
jgi:hypothetical protein